MFQRAGYKVESEQELTPHEKLELRHNAERIKVIGGDYEAAGIMDRKITLTYEGATMPHNDLSRFYRFLARSPETGQIESSIGR